MTSNGDEFSFHEMEEVKRRLEEAVAASAPGSVAPSGMAAPVPESSPQEFFSRNTRSDMESLQFKRALRLFHRHWLTIVLLTIILPSIMYCYDEVLNSPNIPVQLRRGAIRRYESIARLERQKTASSLENIITKYDPLESVSLNRVLTREDFIADLEELLREKQLVLKEAGEEAVVTTLQTYLEAGRGARRRMGNITVRPMQDDAASIRAEGTSPALLSHLANAVTPTLNRYFQRQRRTYIETKLKQHWSMKNANLKKLAEVNRELAVLNERLRVDDPGSYEGVDRLRRFQEERFRLQLQREDMQIRLKHFKQKVNYLKLQQALRIDTDADIAKVVVESNPLRKEWQRLELELTRLRTRYKDVHPAIQAIRSDIDAIQAHLRREGQTNRNGELFPLPTTNQLEALTAVVDMNDKAELNQMLLDELESKIRVETQKKKKWEAEKAGLHGGQRMEDTLVRQRDERQAELRFLQAKALETAKRIAELEMVQQDVGTEADFVLASHAGKAVQYTPNVNLDLMVAVMIGLILGCGVALLIESMDDHLHTPSDVYYHLRLNYLGVIPRWVDERQRVIQPEHPDSHMGEVYAHLCNNIRYGRMGNPEKRLLIASALPGEGKSTIAANIAIRYAIEGNSVVLIDADMRRPRGHKLIEIFEDGQAALENGLSNYLNGEALVDQVLYGTNIPGLTLLPAGGRVRNAARLLGSQRMLDVLDEAEKKFDIVIVDCPAVLPVVDATILAPHMRGVLMVIAAEEAEVGAVRMALYRLQHVGAPIAGAVLNKVQERSTSYTYYGYKYRGGYYYSPYSRTYGDWDENEDGSDEAS